jgi:hypothetical protein
MAGVLRTLMEMLGLYSGHRRESPPLTDIFLSASASGRFEARLFDRMERHRPWMLAPEVLEAHARGMRLLKQNLSRFQRDQYERCGYFEVVGGATGRNYRIRNGSQMNVELLDRKGRPVRLLCFVPEGELVVGDVMLAQKLALELFEMDTLKVANKFPIDLSPFRSI